MRKEFLLVFGACLLWACNPKEPLPEVIEEPQLFISWEDLNGDLLKYEVGLNKSVSFTDVIDVGFGERYIIFIYALDSLNTIQLSFHNSSLTASPDSILDIKKTIVEGEKLVERFGQFTPGAFSLLISKQGRLDSSFTSVYPFAQNPGNFKITSVRERNHLAQKYLEFEYEFELELLSLNTQTVREVKNGKGVAAFPL
jgi:hypothetical protein